MKNKKEKEAKKNLWVWIIGFIFIATLFYFLFITLPHAQQIPELVCEETYFIKIGLEPFEGEYIKGVVVDYYIDEKVIHHFYWDKLCEDLLKVRLNETLSKSDNFWLNSYADYFEKEIQLECNYNIKWGEIGDFYGREVESGREIFRTEELLLAQLNRPLKYNESLINIEWRELMELTRIKNNNPDYLIVLNIKLNESIMECT